MVRNPVCRNCRRVMRASLLAGKAMIRPEGTIMAAMPEMTGSRLFAQMMQGYGVSHVFFVPAVLMQAMAEMEDLGIVRVVTHGEKAAAYMADGYARASHRPGVCLAQHVGAANLAAGLRDAYMACSPVIAVTGGDDATTHYRHGYQQIDDFPMFERVTTFAARVDAVQR